MLYELREEDLGDGVRSGGSRIHLRAGDRSVVVGDIHGFLNLFVAGARVLRKTLNVNAECLALADLEAALLALARVDAEVLDDFVVDLADLRLNFEGDIGVAVFTDASVDLLASLRNNAFVGTVTRHRVRLAGAGLPVSEETGVEALPGVVEHVDADLVIDKLLVVIL